MARKKKEQPEQEAGAPEWMVTFSDCMTLLLTFFVLLLSFASFNKETLPSLANSFAQAMPSVGMSYVSNRESLQKKQATRDQVNQTVGTETRTNVDKLTSNFMKEKKPLDFRNLRVFTIPSDQFFWGRGAAISQSGRQVLDALAKFLQSTQGRVVISENGPDGKTELGLGRCVAVLDYFTKERGLPAGRFSISSSTTLRSAPNYRQLEITLLERSIYE